MEYLYPLYAAIAGLIIGYCGEGNIANNVRTPGQKFWQIIKWISLIIIALYIVVILMAISDGIAGIPLLGGAYWVRGHWRRY